MMLKNVEIYSKSNCVFCDKAKHYFAQNNITYVEHNVEIPEVFEALMFSSEGGVFSSKDF